jgi:hypothetical protein
MNEQVRKIFWPPPAEIRSQRQHRWTPAWVIVTGALAAVAGYVLGHTTLIVAYTDGRTVSQVNGLCTSAIGQFAQASNSRLSGNCGQVAMYEQAHGWLIILGVVAIAAGIAWHLRQKGTAA